MGARNINDPLIPLHISIRRNISLVGLDHGDQIGVGLLTKAEFVIAKPFVDHYFDVSSLDNIMAVILALASILCV
jgi:hypothetical protein